MIIIERWREERKKEKINEKMLSVSVSRDAQINATDISHAAIIKLNYDYHRLIPLHEIFVEKLEEQLQLSTHSFVVFIL